MRNRVILHVGRHKTGTSALQQFLYSNTDLLSRHGYVYPRSGLLGYNHGSISNALQQLRHATPQEFDKFLSSTATRTFIKQVANCSGHAILSSEGFQNCKPEQVARLFEPFQTNVVVYIREQVDYFISSYAQKVRVTRYTGDMNDYFCKTFSALNYHEFLSCWQNAFSQRKINVRKYKKETLVNGDIVHDFLVHALAINPDQISSTQSNTNANPSLDAKLLAYKLHLNRTTNIPDIFDRALYKVLSELSSGNRAEKQHVLPRIKELIISQCTKNDNLVAEKYFNQSILFEHNTPTSDQLFALRSRDITELNQFISMAIPGISQFLGPAYSAPSS